MNFQFLDDLITKFITCHYRYEAQPYTINLFGNRFFLLFGNLVDVLRGFLFGEEFFLSEPFKVREIQLIIVGWKFYTAHINHYHFVIDDIDHFSFFIRMKNKHLIAYLEFHIETAYNFENDLHWQSYLQQG